jgi:hypothetical protein
MYRRMNYEDENNVNSSSHGSGSRGRISQCGSNCVGEF